MSRMLLQVKDLFAGYGGTEVLHGLSMEIEEGSITTLLGANGAGKTTTLRALCKMIKVRGQIMFDGQAVEGKATEDIVRLGVAHVPDGRGTFGSLSTEENLQLGSYTRKDKHEVALDQEKMYSYFPRLKERRNQQAGTLSGGEQQMLAIGRALMSAPRLIMVDEVSQGLAPVVVQEVYRQLKRLSAQGMTVLMVEQNARLAFELASQVYVMEQGSVVAHGPTEELAQSVHVRNAYLGLDAT